MSFYIAPPFPKGIDTLCNLKSMFHQFECLEATNSFRLLDRICDPLYEFKHMIQVQNRDIENLDPSNTAAARIQKIWRSFYNEAFHAAPDMRRFAAATDPLRSWMEEHRGRTIARDFIDTAIVISEEPETESSPPNLVTIEKVERIQQEFRAFLSHLQQKMPYHFYRNVRQKIANIMVYREGHRLIALINEAIGSSPLSFKKGRYDAFSLGIFCREGKTVRYYKIYLTEELAPYICRTEAGEAKTYYCSGETTLFHELVHCVHSIKNQWSETSLNYDPCMFTNASEAKTILGSPRSNGGLSENSFRKQLRLQPRCAHVEGIDRKGRKPEENLSHAIQYNIAGDYSWLFKSITPVLIDKIYRQAVDSIRDKIAHLPLLSRISSSPVHKPSESAEQPTKRSYAAVAAGKHHSTSSSETVEDLVLKNNLASPVSITLLGIHNFWNFWRSQLEQPVQPKPVQQKPVQPKPTPKHFTFKL